MGQSGEHRDRRAERHYRRRKADRGHEALALKRVFSWGDRGFESFLLLQRVRCEPDFGDKSHLIALYTGAGERFRYETLVHFRDVEDRVVWIDAFEDIDDD